MSTFDKSEKILTIQYLIYSNLGNEVYNGSTTLTIKERLKLHISDYHQYKKGRKDYYKSSIKLFDKHVVNNCKIKELDQRICTRQERFALEGEFTLKYKNDPQYICVNEIVNNGKFVGIEKNVSVQGEHNMLNKSNKTGVAGVMFHKFSGLWRARISVNGKRYELGDYPTFEEAVDARLRKENALLGKCHVVAPIIYKTEIELLE